MEKWGKKILSIVNVPELFQQNGQIICQNGQIIYQIKTEQFIFNFGPK